jgi:aspartyl-tRNA(Asn)/glutamyl-tRNA(Gln) amidotransferase subunit B
MIPEAMGARIVRYVSQWGLSVKKAEALTGERADSDLYEKAIDIATERGAPRHGAARGIANLLLQNGAKRANERTARRIERQGQLARPVIVSALDVMAAELAQIFVLREAGKISAGGADELFGALCVSEDEQEGAAADGGAATKAGSARDVEALAQQRGLIIERDESAMAVWVAQAIAENAKAAEDVRAGKDQAVGRIVGAAMKLAAGKGDAAALREAIIRALRG